MDRNGENVIAVAPGANDFLSPADVDRAADVLAECDSLILQLEVPVETVQHAAWLANKSGIRVILNPAPARQLPNELLAVVDVLVPNESEARQLLGLRDHQSLDDRSTVAGLLDFGVRTAVVTRGRKGSLVVTPDEIRPIAAPEVQCVDATAAGDAFTGALAVALSAGMDIWDSVGFASAAAALSVTRMGAQSSMPTSAEVESFIGR